MKCPACQGDAISSNGVIFICRECGLVYEPDAWKEPEPHKPLTSKELLLFFMGASIVFCILIAMLESTNP
jgi:hypothetical protein